MSETEPSYEYSQKETKHVPTITILEEPPAFRVQLTPEEMQIQGKCSNSTAVAVEATPGATIQIEVNQTIAVPITAANVIALMALKPQWNEAAANAALKVLLPLAKQALFTNAAKDLSNSNTASGT